MESGEHEPEEMSQQRDNVLILQNKNVRLFIAGVRFSFVKENLHGEGHFEDESKRG